jgi:hypothetical protein
MSKKVVDNVRPGARWEALPSAIISTTVCGVGCEGPHGRITKAKNLQISQDYLKIMVLLWGRNGEKTSLVMHGQKVGSEVRFLVFYTGFHSNTFSVRLDR